MPGRRHEKKVHHVNLMKKWHVITPHPQAALLTTGSELQDEITSAENPEEWVGSSTKLFFPVEDGGSQDVTLDLPEPQRVPLQQILLSLPRVLAKTPGRTTVVQHYINVGDAVPVQQWPYRVPYSQRELVKQELDRMLKAKVI